MPTKTLHGKRCLITGAASGIGRATAQATAARGGELFLTDVNEAALHDVARGRAWRAPRERVVGRLNDGMTAVAARAKPGGVTPAGR